MKQKQKHKALVLNSGGVDSTTLLAMAIRDHGKENVATVLIMYGQRHQAELTHARKIAEYYDVPCYELNISSVFAFTNSCPLLANSTKEVPQTTPDAERRPGRSETFVPGRNGVMLSSVASLAQQIFPDEDVDIYLGAHADDANGDAYADCSPEFTDAMRIAIWVGSYKKVRLITPFVHNSKADIVKVGLELNVPYELTYSCYSGTEPQCGKCNTCIDRIKAFEANGVKDPAFGGDNE